MRTALQLADFTDQFVMEEAQKLRGPYALKRTMRYASTRDHTVHSESVAEHVFGLLYLAQCFLPLEDPDRLMDWVKVSSIILYHDFGEMVHGDVPYHRKTMEHEERERTAAVEVFGGLPELIGTVGYAYWRDYEGRMSPEARFVYALDKVEPIFELWDPVNELSMKRLCFSYEQHIGKKFRATEHFPVMRRFVEAMTADMILRRVFWAPSMEEDGA